MATGKSQVWLLICSRCSARAVHGEESEQEEEKEVRNPSGTSNEKRKRGGQMETSDSEASQKPKEAKFSRG